MSLFRFRLGSAALWTSLVYLLLAGGWLYSSERWLEALAGGRFSRLTLDTVYLLVPAVLLYVLLRLFEWRHEALTRHYVYLGKYTNDIVFLLDHKGRVVECNEHALTAYGYPRAEMLAMHGSDLRIEKERATFGEDWRRQGNMDGLTYETVHRRKDGSSFPVEVSARPIKVRGRELRQIIIRDITERKQAEQALRASEEKFRRIMETTPVGSYVIQDLIFKYVNPAMAQMFGYTPDEIIDRLGPPELVVPEERERISRNLTERAHGVPGHPYEVKSLRKDGSSFDSLVWGIDFEYEGRPASVGTLIDISERKHAETDLRKLWRAIEQNPSTVIITNRKGIIEYVNPRFSETTGYTREEVVGKYARMLKSRFTSEQEFRQMWKTIAGGQTWRGEFKNTRKDGSLFWESAIISPVLDERGKISHFIALKDDITDQKTATERIEYLSHFDTLTGLPNQEVLRDRLQQAIAVAQRNQEEVAVLFFDLDRFKYINDALGHAIGDRLLQELALRLKQSCRLADTLARMSADEFVVVLPETGPTGVAHVVQKLMKLMEQPFNVKEQRITFTASIGISLFPSDGHDPDTLLRNADTAMHHAKAQGGNSYQFFTASMNVSVLQHMTVEHELRRALELGELEVFFQPQVRLSDGVISGAEALVRWRHPQRGMVAPSEFIPIAEESGLIIELGEWVLHEACRQAKAWQDSGLPAITVAVNLSAVQFRRRNVLQQVRDALDKSGLEPRWLELELTESVILQDADVVLDKVKQLGAIGVTVSIDDFGTGYSSLSYLCKFPLDKLKIDQSFVRDMLTSSDNAEIVRTIVGMAHNLRLEVLAEGVETIAQFDFLRDLGCDQMQGYYCAKPMPAADFAHLLGQNCPLPQL